MLADVTVGVVWCEAWFMRKTGGKWRKWKTTTKKYFYKLVALETYFIGHGAVTCRLPVVYYRDDRALSKRCTIPSALLCCGLMIMGCSHGLACDVWCELPRRYHWARPFGLSKGRDGLGGFCANNSWVYMVGSVQIDTICFPISRLAIEYKAHNQRQRARSTPGTWGNCAMIKT